MGQIPFCSCEIFLGKQKSFRDAPQNISEPRIHLATKKLVVVVEAAVGTKIRGNFRHSKRCRVGLQRKNKTENKEKTYMEFQNLGKHCEFSGCQQLDFLPFKCDGCEKAFCLDHRSFKSHSCHEKNITNSLVPLCPLCGQGVSVGKNQEINQVMEEHLINGCRTKEQREIMANRCQKKGCKKSELVPFNCSKCHHQYCSKHRSPFDHQCAGRKEVMRQIGPFRVPVRVS
jgi:hypothetical protein